MHKPYKIAYIELDCHAEVVNNFMSLMNDSKLFNVDYFLAKHILDELDILPSCNVFIVDENNVRLKLSKSYQLVIIGTANTYFNLYKKIAKQYNTALIVHNLNFVQTPAGKILRKIFNQNKRSFLRLWLQGILHKDKLQRLTRLLVLDKRLITQSNGVDIQLLPLSFNLYNKKVVLNQPVKVVIPGTVNNNRRDYQHVLEKIKYFTSEMEIYLLGKAEEEDMLRKLSQTQASLHPNIRIIYYDDYISQEAFENVLKAAHLVLCPLQEKTFFMGVNEYYGKTKITGNINDAIKFGKPIILPDHYKAKDFFIFTEQDDIEKQIKNIATKVFEFEEFSKEKVLRKLEDALTQLLAK